MIPKIIHYCWLSDDAIPSDLINYMRSWQRVLPDYEFIKWDFNRFPKEKSLWVKQAFENKKYAFAADYIRTYALYNFGGIYMDMDVEVLKSFNDLLHRKYILSIEGPYGIEAAVMGCEKGFPLFGYMLDYYRGRNFVKDDGSFDTKTLPLIMNEIISRNYKSTLNLEHEDSNDPNTIFLYTWNYFTGLSYPWCEVCPSEKTYTIHHRAGSWVGKEKYDKKYYIKRLFDSHVSHFLIFMRYFLELYSLKKHRFHRLNIWSGMIE